MFINISNNIERMQIIKLMMRKDTVLNEFHHRNVNDDVTMLVVQKADKITTIYGDIAQNNTY